MALSQMVVFNQYLRQATIETVAQMVEKFNSASNGAIQLTTNGIDGDFLMESTFQSLHSAQRRVDRYATNASQASTPLTQIEQDSVKIAGGFGPILLEPSQMTYIQQTPELAIELISRNMAEAITQDQLNTAIAALVAAIGNNASVTNDVSASTGGAVVTYGALNSAHALFGDHSTNLVTEVMTGAMFHALIGDNLSNANRLFDAGNVQVIDILGKVVVVTDAPALQDTAGTPPTNSVLSLTRGAAIVHDGSDLITNVETTNGKERIESTMQADYTFGLGLKGYSWDTANGGKSPTDTELATGTNWDKYVTSDKHTAGVLTIGNITAT